MFIREKKTENHKTGKIYIKHVLVESYQTKNGTRQRTIMHLGRLELHKKHWPILAKELEQRLAGASMSEQLSYISENKTKKDLEIEKTMQKLADKSLNKFHSLKIQTNSGTLNRKNEIFNNNDDKLVEEADSPAQSNKKQFFKTVDCNSLTTSFSRSLGAELVGHHVFQQLQFPDILKKCGFTARLISLSEAIILSRLIRPASELSTWQWLRENSAISEITKVPLTDVKKNSIYEIGDELLANKKALEKHLLKREQKLFPDRQSLYLFDLTNFYMEGNCAKNTLAQFGKSKEKRNDLRIVSLALMVDSEGFPITTRVYEGNIGEPATLEDILRDMGYLQKNDQMEFASTKPILVMDRGIATIENIKLIKDNQFPYILIERAPRHKDYVDDFDDYQNKFEPIIGKGDQKVWIHRVAGSDEKTCRVLCVSEGRKAKEKAIADRWVERAIKDLELFRCSILKGYIKDINKVYQRLGRIKGRYKGFSKRFSVQVIPDTDSKKAADLSWKVIKVSPGEKETLFGCYVIETDQIHQTAANIWHLYITLTRVEAAFQSLKTDLGTRPIYHQLARRTEAHIFISILAYHILISIEYQLSKQGDNRSWKTIRSILETHRRDTIIFTDKDKIIHHIRQSGQPEAKHMDIYRKLQVRNPLLRNHYTVCRRTR